MKFLAFLIGLEDRTKAWIDTVSIGTIIATFLSSLPHVAAGLSVIWGLIRIYETKTVQKLLGRKPDPAEGA